MSNGPGVRPVVVRRIPISSLYSQHKPELNNRNKLLKGLYTE